jgi:hypothetical protein
LHIYSLFHNPECKKMLSTLAASHICFPSPTVIVHFP